MIIKSIFITNQSDLNSDVLGGVQICSQEYLASVKYLDPEVIIFNVNVSKNLSLRIKRKLNFDSYDWYFPKSYKEQLTGLIKKNNINIVFINRTELIKFSKLIKEIDSEIKVIVLSHGNESGDYLHQLSHPNNTSKFTRIRLFKSKVRLGLNLFEESYYRHRYVDLVCAMSEEEEAIEKWLGAKNTFYFPRIIDPSPIETKPIENRVGFVGTLNHEPNYIALDEVCKILQERTSKITVRLIGGGNTEGHALAKKYKFVEYLGKLNDNQMKSEVASWSYFLNPIFWYSRGASMKLGQALKFNIPVITSSAGMRGYKFKNNFLDPSDNNAQSFVENLLKKTSVKDTSKDKMIPIDLKLLFIPKEQIFQEFKKNINCLFKT